jgi:hypothetical protein
MERLVRVILWQRPDAGRTEITVAPRSAAIYQTRTARIKGSFTITHRKHAGARTRESERLKTMPRAEYTNMSHARLRLLGLWKPENHIKCEWVILHLRERLAHPWKEIITENFMSQKNKIEAEKLNPTTDFLPSDGASCSHSSVSAGVRVMSHRSGVPSSYPPTAAEKPDWPTLPSMTAQDRK